MSLRILVAPSALVIGDVEIGGEEHAYLARVRRAARGDAVVLFDGAGRSADATLVAIEPARTVARVAEIVATPALSPRLTAVIPLIKGDRMDVCLEKLVEVGVDDIVLYEAARAVVRLDGARAAERMKRFAAQLLAAARQAGRARAPGLAAPVPLAAALAATATIGARWVGDPSSDQPPRWPSPLPADGAVLTGPEGGLSPDELRQAIDGGWTPVALGPYVLRAETAPVVAIAHLRLGTRR